MIVYFMISIVTTIGWGAVKTDTAPGRAAVMVFAIVGLPLYWYANALLARRLRWMLAPLYRRFGCCCDSDKKNKSGEGQGGDGGAQRRMVLSRVLVVNFTVALLFMFIGAAIFYGLYDWPTFFDAVWFCFVTLTTIGYGDKAPGFGEGTISVHPAAVLLQVVYIVVGCSMIGLQLQILSDAAQRLHQENVKVRYTELRYTD